MRIIARLLALLPLLWVEGVYGSPCNSGYTLTDQASVDSLGETLTNAGCGEVYSLRISGSSVVNVDALVSLTTVKDSLRIEDTGLYNLDGLVNLVSVGSSEITSINPDFPGDLRIFGNQRLTNIDGLVNLKSVAGTIYVNANGALPNLDGFAGLASAGGVSLLDRGVSDVDGFASLQTIEGELYMYRSPITNVDGFGSLESVGKLTLDDLDALQNVDGFINLKRTGPLTVVDNDILTDLDGFIGLDDAGRVTVRSNYVLTGCEALAPHAGWPDRIGLWWVDIRDNGGGCSWEGAIFDSVSGPTKPEIIQATVSGTSLELTLIPSTTTDELFPVTGYTAVCSRAPFNVSDSPDIRLPDNTPVETSLSVSGYDQTSLSSTSVSLSISHPDPSDRIRVTLKTPAGTELALYEGPVSALTIDNPLSNVTTESLNGEWVLVLEDIDVGPIVREGVLNSWSLGISEVATSSGEKSPIVFSEIGRGRDYTCTVETVTRLPFDPVSEPFTVTVPYEVPASPTITLAEQEDGQVTLTFTAGDDGGKEITGYEATCTDGANTYTGTSISSPITVSGLTNGVAYTCTVTATNSVGTSSASAATAPITPEESTDSLPIWLLYKASQ